MSDSMAFIGRLLLQQVSHIKQGVHCQAPLQARLSYCLPLPAGFFYSNADQRERLVAAERQLVDDRVQKVLDLKRKVTAAETRRKQCRVHNLLTAHFPTCPACQCMLGIFMLVRHGRRRLNRPSVTSRRSVSVAAT